MNLLDTDILIDYLRFHPPAAAFLENLPKQNRYIAFISPFELLKGCVRKTDEKLIERFLKAFKIVPVSPAIGETAFYLYHQKRWKVPMDIPDSFIAATALVKKFTLFTRNTKHYIGISGLKIQSPY